MLIFLTGILCLSLNTLKAQQDATISPDKILCWIGEGSNEVIFISNWNDPDTALAWGYRFNSENISVKEVMDEIATADPRFEYEASGSMVSNLTYQDGNINLTLSGYYWMFLINGSMGMNYYDAEFVVDGDYIKWGDESCGTLLDPNNYIYVWTKEVTPVNKFIDETISPNDIIYWVGEGLNEIIFIVNWNNPNIAFAWGLRFNENSLTVKSVMDAIMTADKRFAYETFNGMIENIIYNDGEYNLSLYGNWWLYVVNGGFASGYETQIVVNGDYIKWGDESCAYNVGNWNYIWNQTVTPVTPFTDIVENQQYKTSLYPNPTISSTILTINGVCKNINIMISDLQGRIVRNENVFVNGQKEVMIETEDFKRGIYFIILNDGNNSQIQKLIVK